MKTDLTEDTSVLTVTCNSSFRDLKNCPCFGEYLRVHAYTPTQTHTYS